MLLRYSWLAILFFAIQTEAAQHPLSITGDSAYQNQNYAQALIAYNSLIQEIPDRKEGYFNRALCLYHTEKYSESFFDFDESFRIDTAQHSALALKALCLEKRGDFNEAMRLYRSLPVADFSFPFLQRVKTYERASFIASKWYYILSLACLAGLLAGLGILWLYRA